MASAGRRPNRRTLPEIYFIDNSADADTETDADDGGSDASEEDEYRVDQSEEEEEEGDEYEEVHEEGGEDYEPDIPMNPSPRVSAAARPTPTAPGQAEACKGRRGEEGDADSMPSGRNGTNQGGCAGGESSQSETDAMCCPICFQPWTSEGDHHVCCLPCGHIYGMSCIRKWIQRCQRSAKCPQCNRKCMLKDIRKLYTSRIVAVDNGSQKEVEFLETKCASLKAKCASLETKAADWVKTEDHLRQQVHELTERKTYLERSLKYSQRRPFGYTNLGTDCQGQLSGDDTDSQGLPCTFILQEELEVDGARLFDVDVSGATLIVAQRLSGMGGMHSLSKMSLITHGRENIQLPSDTKAIKDLRVSPAGGLALLASLGKKLSVLSLDSNNMILAYDLPAPAWSCAWNRNSSHTIYAGLQNGMVLVFDMRQTARPMESLSGPTCNPVHTVHPLLNDATLPSGVASLITASSVGLCKWTFGGSGEGPYLIPETENHGVCISLASSQSSNNIVATFRPKVQMYDNIPSVSQSLCSPRSSPVGQGIRGTHVLFKQTDDQCYQNLASAITNVNEIRFPRSVIIDDENQGSVFASGDDVSNEMVLHELPSLDVSQHLKPHGHPIRDVRYTNGVGLGLLGCLSESKLQLFFPDFQWTD